MVWIRRPMSVALLAAMLVHVVDESLACSCFPSSFFAQVRDSRDLNRVRVIGEVEIGDDGRIVGPRNPRVPLPDINGQRYYRARVVKTFNGCVAPSSDVIIETGGNSALCGAILKPKTTYLLNTRASGFTEVTQLPSLSINICGLIREWSRLTRLERWFVRGRVNQCRGQISCTNGVNIAAVSCPAATCRSLSPCRGGSSCEINPCQGCRINWFKKNEQLFDTEDLVRDGSCGSPLPRFLQ